MKKTLSEQKLERKSSIENEPLTLSLEQLHHAREAARKVMNTKSLEEALSIFTEGLEPVPSTSQRGLAGDFEEMGLFAVPHWRLCPFIPGMRDIMPSPF